MGDQRKTVDMKQILRQATRMVRDCKRSTQQIEESARWLRKRLPKFLENVEVKECEIDKPFLLVGCGVRVRIVTPTLEDAKVLAIRIWENLDGWGFEEYGRGLKGYEITLIPDGEAHLKWPTWRINFQVLFPRGEARKI